MYVLIGIALKSLLIAGITLGLLELMKRRSAAERSWVAHVGLVALLLLAIAPLALPSWNVEAPALLGREAPAAATVPTALPAPAASSIAPAPEPIVAAAATDRAPLNPITAAMMVYAVPAAILLLITVLALGRLIALRARADVLVDGHWLSALARAQRRMGFKHGTALLTSDDLTSPISWGLMRPVILLNSRAVEASRQAEAIIAHELAHVARMDWAKLLLARLATALFWFNPLVWILAREAHQLREEAADDAVLAANIVDTDYAQLLVGVARHECPGLFLGAHGVAPSKNSLKRRIARVLDGKSVRGPVARSFALGMFAGAVLVAAPLAALTLTPAGSSGMKLMARSSGGHSANVDTGSAYHPGNDVPADLPRIIAKGVSTSVSTAVAAVAPVEVVTEAEVRAAAIERAAEATERMELERERTRKIAKANRTGPVDIDAIIQTRRLRGSVDYMNEMNEMRAAAPRLANLDPAGFTRLQAVGITPQFARDFVAAGFRNITAGQLTDAQAVGLTGGYARALAAAGVPLNIEDHIRLKTVGVPPDYVRSLRRAGYVIGDAGELVDMWIVHVRPEELRLKAPGTARPPRLRSTNPRPNDRPGADDG